MSPNIVQLSHFWYGLPVSLGWAALLGNVSPGHVSLGLRPLTPSSLELELPLWVCTVVFSLSGSLSCIFVQ
jgi:hypothetical protein